MRCYSVQRNSKFIYELYKNDDHLIWVPYPNYMTCLRVADGEDGLQIWRVTAIIINKQSRTADKG